MCMISARYGTPLSKPPVQGVAAWDFGMPGRPDVALSLANPRRPATTKAVPAPDPGLPPPVSAQATEPAYRSR